MPDLPPTRQSLLIELGKRNDVAWSEFLAVYEQAVIGYCVRRGLQEADARDVAQEVFAALHGRLESWEPDSGRGSFRAWLFRVARNISVDLISARARSAVDGIQAEQMLTNLVGIDGQDAQESTAFQLEWQRALFDWAAHQVRDEVRESTWAIFQMTAIDGKSAKAVAGELNLPVGSVYTAKCRVMARIKEHVQHWDPDAAAGSSEK